MNDLKKYFPWFKKNNGWIYLDSSATSLKPQCVIDEVVNYYEKYSSNPHNKDSALTYAVSQKIDQSRKIISSFFNANEKEIVFTSGATESLNLIILNVMKPLKKNDEVIVSYGEHTSNLLPWLMGSKAQGFKLVFAKDKNNFPTERAFIDSITKKTKIISLNPTNSLFGFNFNIKNIVKAARKINKNIIVIIDATQTAPSQGLDFKGLDIDFFTCSGHKMLGPDGVGILCGKSKLLEKFTPIKFGGGTISLIKNMEPQFAPIPDRLEGGTPNVEGILGFAKAIEFIKKIGIKNIIKHEKTLKMYIDEQFTSIPNLIYPSKGTPYPICSIGIKRVSPQDLANYLGNNKIIVRGGMACVKMVGKFADPNGYVRASFYLYNDKNDVDKLVKVLKAYKRGDELKKII
ncbi:MAG: aminotransferase class V-fold PLP-dependent enzyme [Mycoplasmoidaceae bacterium]|nr:MAG: aminotransferase class V-fold PLP-dependent enzyme [Mycoplasmoidaceae bacterium]